MANFIVSANFILSLNTSTLSAKSVSNC